MAWVTKTATTGRVYAGGHMPYLGGYLYMVGGMTSGTITGSTARSNLVDRYDPVANVWTARAVLPTYLAGHAVATDGTYIWAVNGTTHTSATAAGGSWNTTQAFQYNPTSNTWTTHSLTIPARTRVQGAIIGDKFYVVTNSEILEYTLTSSSITYTNSYIPTGFEATYDSVCVANSGQLYIIFKSGVHKRWNPSSPSTMTTLASAPSAWLETYAPVYVAGGYNYLIGGTNSSTYYLRLYRYDLASNTWTLQTGSMTYNHTEAQGGFELRTPSLITVGGYVTPTNSAGGAQGPTEQWALTPISGSATLSTPNARMYVGPLGEATMTATASMSVTAASEYSGLSGPYPGFRMEGTTYSDPYDGYPSATTWPSPDHYPPPIPVDLPADAAISITGSSITVRAHSTGDPTYIDGTVSISGSASLTCAASIIGVPWVDGEAALTGAATMSATGHSPGDPSYVDSDPTTLSGAATITASATQLSAAATMSGALTFTATATVVAASTTVSRMTEAAAEVAVTGAAAPTERSRLTELAAEVAVAGAAAPTERSRLAHLAAEVAVAGNPPASQVLRTTSVALEAVVSGAPGATTRVTEVAVEAIVSGHSDATLRVTEVAAEVVVGA